MCKESGKHFTKIGTKVLFARDKLLVTGNPSPGPTLLSSFPYTGIMLAERKGSVPDGHDVHPLVGR